MLNNLRVKILLFFCFGGMGEAWVCVCVCVGGGGGGGEGGREAFTVGVGVCGRGLILPTLYTFVFFQYLVKPSEEIVELEILSLSNFED